METKICKSCLVEKPKTDFGKDKISKDNLRYRCKECEKSKIPSKGFIPILEGESKVCLICNKLKDLSFFQKRKGRKYSHEPRCKQCAKEGKTVDLGIYKEGKRRCSCCKEYKDLELYYLDKNKKPFTNCKECNKKKSKEYRKSLTIEEIQKRRREEYLKNREGYLRRSKEHALRNKEENREKRREYEKNLKNSNFGIYLRRNISSLIRVSLKKRKLSKNGKKVTDILKCSVEEFKKHIESQFLNWMSWDNYGNCETNDYDCSWHLDHIIPLSSAKTKEEIYLLNHWSNFQPICSYVNKNIKRGVIYPCCNLELNKTF